MLLLLLLPAAALAQSTTFNYAGSAFQTYVVPASGWYLLDVQGAQGGPASNLSHQGGKGARVQGYVYLSQGALLRIAVGGEGGRGQGDGNNVSGGGGGGGSSVAVPSGSVGTPSPSDVILLMAGGGGGAAANYNGSSGLEFEAGGPPNEGVYGHGAGVGSSEWGGAGGAGYRTNGGTHYSCSCASAELLSTGGQAYLNGNHGGVSSVACSFCGRGGAGGWGGGGEGGPAWSGLFSQVDGGGGGGGGYSGGGGGARQGDGGGGGGSYVSSTVDTTLCLAVRGYRSGHGLVQITPVSGPPVVQQPANQQVAIGQAVTLGPVFYDPSGQTTYAWMKDGVVLADQTSATLTIASFQSTDSGCYQAIVKQASAMCITLPALVSPSASLATLQGWGSNTAGELGLGDTIDLVYSAVQLTSGVVTMAAGSGFSYFVKTDGTLWSMGGNHNGELGLGDNTDRTAPAQVTSGVVAVAAGQGHTLFVKSDGTLWSTGANYNGQLGLANNTNRNAPAQVTTGVVAVAAGASHSLFVKRDGTLWCMGDNASGQLGVGNNTDRNAPMQVASGVVAVAAGQFHTLFLKRDGTVWSTGMGDEGQLGLLGDGSISSPRQVTEQLNSDVVSVAAGYKHSLLVKRDGTLLGTGRNRSGELGLGSNVVSTSVPYTIESDVVAAVGGYRYSLFVKRDGTLWSMGDNTYGQLGVGCQICYLPLNQVYFRNSTNQPTTPIVVATLPKMPTAAASLVTAAPALSTVQASQGGVSIGQFALALRDVPSGQYREAIADDPSTGWSADAIYWNNQNQIRFAVRFRNSAGTNDITAFGAFTLDDPSEAEFLALRTADLRRIGIQPSANASNQARYQAFQSLMNSATLEQLRARFGGFLPDLDIGFAW